MEQVFGFVKEKLSGAQRRKSAEICGSRLQRLNPCLCCRCRRGWRKRIGLNITGHRTLSLYAALQVKTGPGPRQDGSRLPGRFIGYLTDIVDSNRATKESHIVPDEHSLAQNLSGAGVPPSELAARVLLHAGRLKSRRFVGASMVQRRRQFTTANRPIILCPNQLMCSNL